MTENKTGYMLAGILIVTLVLSIYSNTLQSPWILDDYHNIISNPRIQIKSLSAESIKESFFSYIGNSEKLYRPVACFTFAMNAIIGGKNVSGYHIVNISIHATASMLLLWLLIMIFRTPALDDTPERKKRFIIILSTLFWAVNPIQIQAVTYIVQRMTSLCALFSIISLVFFIKARLSESKRHKATYYSICFFAIILSTLSKENGILSIPLIFCIEFFLFRNGDFRYFQKTEILKALLFFIIIAICFFFFTAGISSFNEGYAKRPFTMYERILTQPGVLLYYLSLIFYPMPHRFSLEHEILISSGFFSPPQTFIYIVITITLLLACIFSKRIPLLARLGVTFYYIAHSIESGIIPLEMIFEHRNYLPSIFLFPPAIAGLYRIYDYYGSHKKKGFMAAIVFFFITALIFMTSIATYTRNFDWQSGERIWLDAMTKAPGNSRPKQSMGFVTGMKNPEKTIYYYTKALTGYMHDPKEEKSSSLVNIGFIYFHQKNFEKARSFFGSAVEIQKKHEIAHLGIIQSYMNEGKWDKALEAVNNSHKPEMFKTLKALCFLNMGNYSNALELFGEIYRNNPDDDENLLNFAESLSMAGFYDRACFYYGIYCNKYPSEPNIFLRLSKNTYLKGDIKKASFYLKKFFILAGAEKTKFYINKAVENNLLPLAELGKMLPYISQEFEQYKKNIKILDTSRN